MDAIIRAPSVALETRQLRRSIGIEKPSQAIAEVKVAHEAVVASAIEPLETIRGSFHEKETPPSTPDPEIQHQIEVELANARALAEKQGFAQGLERGEDAAKKSVSEQVERLVSIAASLYRAKASVLESAEDATVEIVYTAICRIVGETATTRMSVVSMVNEVLAAFRECDQLVVRLHPQDFALAQQASDASDIAVIDQQTVLRADASIKIGGCVVDSQTGSLDARLDTQLNRLREALLLARRSRGNVEEAI